MRSLLVLTASVTVAAGLTVPAAATASAPAAEMVVVLDEKASPEEVADQIEEAGGRIVEQLEGAVDGFVVEADKDAAHQINRLDSLLNAAPNVPVTIAATQLPAPSWGLDRLDGKVGDGYRYSLTGQGVTIYVVDTGVTDRVSELGSRLKKGYNAVGDGLGTADCNGHGSVVASIAAGTTFGVAKSATVVPVRVMGCDGAGDSSDLIESINWIIANHPAGSPAVINMSLSAPANAPLATAVTRAIDSGFTVVAAAGNSNDDACRYTPANVPAALTVAASTSSDKRANFSNYGTCVDVFAPGDRVVSAANGLDTVVSSGTSMAAPHSAGVAAQILEKEGIREPETIISTLLSLSLGNAITDVAGSPNQLTQTVLTDTEPTPAPEQPLPAIERVAQTYVKKAVSKPTRRLAAAPAATAATTQNISVTANQAPVRKGQRVTIDIRVNGAWVRWGKPTVQKTGTVRVPAVKINIAGTYPVRFTTPTAVVYAKIQAR